MRTLPRVGVLTSAPGVALPNAAKLDLNVELPVQNYHGFWGQPQTVVVCTMCTMLVQVSISRPRVRFTVFRKCVHVLRCPLNVSAHVSFRVALQLRKHAMRAVCQACDASCVCGMFCFIGVGGLLVACML